MLIGSSMQALENWLNALLGLQASSLSASHMGARAVVVYIVAWLMVRIVGDRRFVGKYAAIDVILSITLGATLSRAINGSAAFFPTFFAGVTLVAMHWLLGAIAFHLPQLEPWIKGQPRTLVRQGEQSARAMRKSHLTVQDLQTALRSKSCSGDLNDVDLATLELNGDVSVLTQSTAHVVEVTVEEGVQTVRIVVE